MVASAAWPCKLATEKLEMKAMMLPITLTIAGAAALMNVWLGLRVSMVRRLHKVSIGDGGQSQLMSRMRAHSNFIEYTPFFLILLALVELARGAETWLWAVGIIFILGRLLHPFGMDRTAPNFMRIASMVITWACLLGLAAYALTLPYLQERKPAVPSYVALDQARASTLSPTKGLLRRS
jgi:uncharacterized membrane protein YecN with MAPEG domain